MTTQDFIFDLPLYAQVKLSDNPNILKDLCTYGISVDGYNCIKNADSTFKLEDEIESNFLGKYATKLVRFVCQRYNHSVYVLVFIDQIHDIIEKVGQFPSVADIHIAQVKQYKKVLGESYIRDFTKAIGLAANGIGTGSFVYLRRVFEHLVTEIADETIKKGEIDKTQFETSKMDNKLKLLSSHLPDVITENKSLYGILSAGIHTLSEEDCLKFFSVVREVIELILDDREYERQREVKKKNAQNKLSVAVGEIKKAVE